MAARLLADRHEILRTGFVLNGFSEPLQLVHRSAEIEVGYDDLREMPAAERDLAVAEFLRRRIVGGNHESGWPPGCTTPALELDTAAAGSRGPPGPPGLDPQPLTGPENLPYLIYASGSTGWPKGVLVEHRALLDYACLAAEAYDPAAGTPLFSALAFDLPVTSVFQALLAGGAVTVAGPRPDPPGAAGPRVAGGRPSHRSAGRGR